MAKRKILIAGASGLVGYAGVRHFARLDGWEVVGVSRRKSGPIDGAGFISVDLLDARHCESIFSQMSDVTHVVYAAVNEKPNLLEGWLERKQMEVNLAMLRNLFEPLYKVAKNLKHVTVLQGTKAYGAHLGPIATPARERAPRHRMRTSIGFRKITSAKSSPGEVGRGPSCDPSSC
jgi:nucleoside-diphosphate-sugar epimerase